jgi:hypothetical protein
MARKNFLSTLDLHFLLKELDQIKDCILVVIGFQDMEKYALFLPINVPSL